MIRGKMMSKLIRLYFRALLRSRLFRKVLFVLLIYHTSIIMSTVFIHIFLKI